ncbi:MAG: DUF167 domain-containing protein [Deltaproteobacteria bacterium]|nr:DUF167 domain-containing protein [Deltaproteobacteria bacterium]MBW1954860.1 DUF167 domain-containing protein [Deltaproteobacteria bacterium]MBW2041243.1 DUF167 domain-containing protein [Deltaproteobacteria bacterium]
MQDESPLDIRDCGTHLVFKVHILPKSSRNAVSGTYLDALKIKLTAPPVEGEANRGCIRLLSKQLKVPKSSLSIVSGQTRRTKHIRLAPSGADAKTQIQRVKTLLAAWTGSKKGP